MSTSVRVRFAPSPTGFLHIGGVRTALFNYLYAKKHNGKFLLRIEDTDLDRSESRFTYDILNSLKWLGMESDEPLMYQSQRLGVYQDVAERLIEKGLAYRCTCSAEDLEAARIEQEKKGEKTMYPRTCREKDLKKPLDQTPFVIRAKFPLTGETGFTDLIRGEIQFPNVDLDDFVMIRSNGVPTYNFCVVVDDLEMKISHVIRGDDHINNTPKQVFLYHAMDASVPLFAHLPMILGQDKKKLSKRNGEVSTIAYRTQGYLPEAVLNFLVRLGWSHGDQEIFSLDEMIQHFGFDNVQTSGAVFNTEKLLWIQGEHLKNADSKRVQKILSEEFCQTWSAEEKAQLPSDLGMALLQFIQPKVKLFTELESQLKPLLSNRPEMNPEWEKSLKWNKDPAQKEKVKMAIQEFLGLFMEKYSSVAAPKDLGLDHAGVDQWLKSFCESKGLKLGEFTSPLRLFLTGMPTSAIGLFDLLPIFPVKKTQARIQALLEHS